ncbi:MAG: hypothetical protein EU536_00085 [Promethearchaeota archaeon]|nr:MAG: hypothetical protein EU536_00085 [Candidatus Lokiarchaeota archaeon]
MNVGFILNYKTVGSFTWSLTWGSANGNDQVYGMRWKVKPNALELIQLLRERAGVFPEGSFQID